MITIVSYEYGKDSGPEGICTERLTEALSAAGLELQVRASRTFKAGACTGSTTRVTRALSVFNRPTRLQKRVGQLLLGAPVEHWAWILATRQKRVHQGIVYGRGNPLCSLVAAERLATKSNARLWLHFSDPIPSPWGDSDRETAVTTSVRHLLDRAEVLTFTTREAIDFMSSTYGLDLRPRSALIRNIVPTWDVSHDQYIERDEIAYIGDFGGRRTPDSLVDGIATANRARREPLRLTLVGSNPKWPTYIRSRWGHTVPVEAVPRTDAVLDYYARAAITACVDAEGTAVFLATKTGEAVQAARRVILVSPKGSPARQLFEGRWETVICSGHDAGQVGDALQRVAMVPSTVCARELPLRQAALSEFRDHSVASVFETLVHSSRSVARQSLDRMG